MTTALMTGTRTQSAPEAGQTASLTPYTTAPKTRSRSMLLIQEELARARIRERLDQAEAARSARTARARRLRLRQTRMARVATRARLLIAFGGLR